MHNHLLFIAFGVMEEGGPNQAEQGRWWGAVRGGQDLASMDWPWAARPPPRSGVGATPAGGASQGLLLGLQGRRGRGGGQGAGRLPLLSYLQDGPAALGRTLPWLRNPVPLPVFMEAWGTPPSWLVPKILLPPVVPSLPLHPCLAPQLLLLRSRGNLIIKPQTTLACLFKPMCTCGPIPQAEQEFPTGWPGRKGVVCAAVGGTAQRQVRELGMFAEENLYQE